MLADQGGSCAICRTAPAVHVDHDHETGAVRALLCFNCNGGLGQFRDDPVVLRAAADYVEHHQQNPTSTRRARRTTSFGMARWLRLQAAPPEPVRRPVGW